MPAAAAAVASSGLGAGAALGPAALAHHCLVLLAASSALCLAVQTLRPLRIRWAAWRGAGPAMLAVPVDSSAWAAVLHTQGGPAHRTQHRPLPCNPSPAGRRSKPLHGCTVRPQE